MAADDISPAISRRLFVSDRSTKLQFLIDTGADVCVFPRSRLPGPRTKSSYELSAANDTTIATYGTVALALDFGLRRQFTWRFVVGAVSKPIIGADFLVHYGLLVDMRNQRLLDATTQLTSHGRVIECDIPSVKTISGSSRYHELLHQFPEVTRPDGTPKAVSHSTRHYITTTPGPPVAQKPRRLSTEKLKAAKKEFEAIAAPGHRSPVTELLGIALAHGAEKRR
ncbi:uncharacterized protein LOC112638086 [Camponotus floridanus]|uniref:uncharacterized protein LOC112638086 n=1 Tax=Camponotus floridanus TaxID=104421 RepID=UPI000DC6C086|nr:uncharacterized protein LOC112638086 [Camponotus floridanus]